MVAIVVAVVGATVVGVAFALWYYWYRRKAAGQSGNVQGPSYSVMSDQVST